MSPQTFVTSVCKELDIPNQQIVVLSSNAKIPGLDCSIPGAYVIPMESGKIFITESLVKMLTEDEQCAVMLHEMTHVQRSHVQKHLAVQMGSSVVFGITMFLPIPLMAKMGALVGITAVDIAGRAAMLHQFEYEADAMTVRYNLHHQLASALRKLDTCIQSMQLKWYVSAINSIAHPDMAKRIARLEKSINGTVVK
jgi:Zn-dependent protease with chaperone function